MVCINKYLVQSVNLGTEEVKSTRCEKMFEPRSVGCVQGVVPFHNAFCEAQLRCDHIVLDRSHRYRNYFACSSDLWLFCKGDNLMRITRQLIAVHALLTIRKQEARSKQWNTLTWSAAWDYLYLKFVTKQWSYLSIQTHSRSNLAIKY